MNNTLPIFYRQIVFVAYFALFSFYSIANTERDSLLNLLEKHKQEDTIKVGLLLDIAQTYWYNSNESYPYIDKALELSNKLSYTKGVIESKFAYLVLASERDILHDKAIADEILEISRAKNYQPGICMAYVGYTGYYMWTREHNLSIEYYNKLKQLCSEKTDPEIIILGSIMASASYSLGGGKYREGEACYDSVDIRLNEIKGKSKLMMLLYWKARLYSEPFRKHVLAIKMLDELERLFTELEDTNGKAVTLLRRSIVEQFFNNYSEQVKCNYKLLKIFKRRNDSLGLLNVTANLGRVYSTLNEFAKAKEYTLLSLVYSRALNNVEMIRYNLQCLGDIYRYQDSLDKAERYYNESIDLISASEKAFLGYVYLDLAKLEDKRNNFNKSQEYHNKAIVLLEKEGSDNLSKAYSSLANHFFKRGLYEKAFPMADTAYILSASIESPVAKMHAANILYKIYALKKDYKNAYAYMQIYNRIKDSINSYEANQIALNYEFEQTLHKNELEQQKKNQLREQELKQQKTLRNFSISGFVLVLFLVLFIYKNYRQKQRANLLLEEKNEEITSQRDEIEAQRNMAIEHSKAIKDSIQYAQKIQSAMLPPEAYVNELLHENFIFYKPRDIVSGDFYWVKQVQHYIIMVAADCTGHGVPGAFMSMLGISFLNEIVQKREITQANQVLNELRIQIKHSLRQHGQKNESKDGMDIALCVINTKTKKMQFAGAFNPLYIIQDIDGKPTLQEIKADRMPVGFYHGKDKSFRNHEIQLEMSDTIYLFTDGFVDQIGGKDGKKYMSKNFKKLLLEIHEQPMFDQKETLEQTLTTWMSGYHQIDDILIIGVRI